MIVVDNVEKTSSCEECQLTYCDEDGKQCVFKNFNVDGVDNQQLPGCPIQDLKDLTNEEVIRKIFPDWELKPHFSTFDTCVLRHGVDIEVPLSISNPSSNFSRFFSFWVPTEWLKSKYNGGGMF